MGHSHSQTHHKKHGNKDITTERITEAFKKLSDNNETVNFHQFQVHFFDHYLSKNHNK